ncbi:MAG: 6-bladed beta-propeller, partial [Parabacteroides sp.]
MKTKYYLFILIALCLFSCGGKNHQSNKFETISINGNIRQALNLSSFVDTIEFIPLETNDENLIGDVERIIYRNGKYYIRTTQGMLHGKLSVFDKTG